MKMPAGFFVSERASMTTQSSMSTFLRTVIGVAAGAGAVVGLMLGAEKSVHDLQAGTLPVSELIYLVLLGIAILVIVAGLLGGRGKVPVFVLVVSFVALGAALSGLMHDFTGKLADVVMWSSGCSFGAAMGLLLARWMTRRA